MQTKTQKVADQLADTTEELQKLKLQQQELQIKLEQTQAQLKARSQVCHAVAAGNRRKVTQIALAAMLKSAAQD